MRISTLGLVQVRCAGITGAVAGSGEVRLCPNAATAGGASAYASEPRSLPPVALKVGVWRRRCSAGSRDLNCGFHRLKCPLAASPVSGVGPEAASRGRSEGSGAVVQSFLERRRSLNHLMPRASLDARTSRTSVTFQGFRTQDRRDAPAIRSFGDVLSSSFWISVRRTEFSGLWKAGRSAQRGSRWGQYDMND